VPHDVFDVVAEDPEVEHVAAQMHEACVQEHRGQHGYRGRHRRIAHHRARVKPLGRHRGVGQDEAFLSRAQRELIQKDQAVQDDQCDRHDRRQRRGIVVP